MLRRFTNNKLQLSKKAVAIQQHRPQLRSFATQSPEKFRRLRNTIATNGNSNPLRGRLGFSYDFEKCIRLIAADSRQCIAWPLTTSTTTSESSSSSSSFDPSTTIVADVVTKEEIELFGAVQRPHPMPLYYLDDSTTRITSEIKRLLQRDADTNVVKIEYDNNNNNNNNNDDTSSNLKSTTYVIQVIEPDIRDVSFQKLEAQVELITAFRNILMDFFELSCPRKEISYEKYEHLTNEKPIYTTLRVPPLSLAFHDGKFDNGIIEKMHHAALIQALHRCSVEVKDWIALHKDEIIFELFVPRSMIESFETAFLDSGEPWETPQNMFFPARTSLYPGMQMPQTLLDTAPGFIGKREEIEALALPYAERVKKLESLEEAEFQKRLEEYSSSTDENSKKMMLGEKEGGDGVTEGARRGENDNSKQTVVTEAGDGVRVTMVGEKMQSSGIFN